MFELAAQLDEQVQNLTILLDKVQETLFQLTILVPDGHSDSDLETEEQGDI